MSTHIYITRHGESQWNVEKRVQGSTDTALTEKGLDQAHQLSKKIKEDKLHIDKILCSPLSRAKITAEIIAEENRIPLEVEPRLVEQNFGKFEGHQWSTDGGVFHEAKKQFAWDYEGGESMLRLGQRIYNLIDELKEKSKTEDKTFLLVTHGGIGRIFHSYFVSETNEDFSSTQLENCEIRKYDFD